VAGKTVPPQMRLLDPPQLANLLPQRMPRFRSGDKVPHAPQWELVELLGAGGFGEVWLAQNSFLDQQRALKFCLDENSRDRLLRYEGAVVR
jgi:serine/threonine protein kinase